MAIFEYIASENRHRFFEISLEHFSTLSNPAKLAMVALMKEFCKKIVYLGKNSAKLAQNTSKSSKIPRSNRKIQILDDDDDFFENGISVLIFNLFRSFGIFLRLDFTEHSETTARRACLEHWVEKLLSSAEANT